MQPTWSGRAADAATDHLRALAGKASEHCTNLEDKANAITLQVFAINDALDQLIGLIEDLLALLPDGSSFEDFIKDLLSPIENGKRLLKILEIAGKMLTKVRLAIDAGAAIISIFSELASLGGVDFPQVDYSAPDVDGP